MPMKPYMPELDDKAVLELTREGERELREPGTALAPLQLEALVLIDGHSTVAQVVKRARNVAPDALRTGLAGLLEKGMIRLHDDQDGSVFDPGDFFTMKAAPAEASQAGEQEQASADADAKFLKRNGYCVNLARRPATARKRSGEGKLEVLVIDDDPDICNLLQTYFKLENFETRTAGNREEIVAALRHTPLPDLVLLDVWMPDANGFDVLAKMRQHPVLKSLPVIMLTAEATREAVLKGILNGADGYITKPFQIHPLVKAVKTVLSIEFNADDRDWDYSH